MKARAQDIEALHEQAYAVFLASHAAAKNHSEMSEAWITYNRTQAAIGAAKGRTKGPKLPRRVEQAQAEAYYRKMEEAVRSDLLAKSALHLDVVEESDQRARAHDEDRTGVRG